MLMISGTRWVTVNDLQAAVVGAGVVAAAEVVAGPTTGVESTAGFVVIPG